MTITIEPETCTRCGICSEVCLSSVIVNGENDSFPRVVEERSGMCSGCGRCVAFCPTGAITRDSVTAEQVSPAPVPPGVLGNYLKSRRSIRKYLPRPVPRARVAELLDIARYAPSAMNAQPVEWLVIDNKEDVQKIAGMTVDWMRGLKPGDPLHGYAAWFIRAWDGGEDVICRGAPHLLIAHVPADNPLTANDAIIALTHVDIAAPAFGLGTCWAGLVASAARSYLPLQDFLSLPAGRTTAYAMMLGYPKHKPQRIPVRKPLQVTWKSSPGGNRK